MRFIAIFIIFLISTGPEASGLPQFIERLNVHINDDLSEVTKIDEFNGKFCQGYIYKEIDFPNGKTPDISLQRIINVLNFFDNKIYPAMIEKYSAHSRLIDQDHQDDKIVILFDNIHDDEYYKNNQEKEYPAFFPKRLSKFYNKDIIIIDVNYLMDDRVELLLYHELQHLLRYRYNQNEEAWLDEGISKFVEYQLVGSSCVRLSNFAESSNLSLKYNYIIPNQANYAHNMLFVIYLYNHFGGLNLIKKLIHGKKSGVENINESLQSVIHLEKSEFKKRYYSFNKIFINYSLALILNSYQDIIESEGLLALDTDKSKKFSNFSISPEEIDYEKYYDVNPWATRYYNLNQDCVELTVSHNQLIVVLLDIYNPDEKRKIRTISEGKICVPDSKKQGQFLVIINPSDQKISFQIGI